jgi:hypothetical protein
VAFKALRVVLADVADVAVFIEEIIRTGINEIGIERRLRPKGLRRRRVHDRVVVVRVVMGRVIVMGGRGAKAATDGGGGRAHKPSRKKHATESVAGRVRSLMYGSLSWAKEVRK